MIPTGNYIFAGFVGSWIIYLINKRKRERSYYWNKYEWLSSFIGGCAITIAFLPILWILLHTGK